MLWPAGVLHRSSGRRATATSLRIEPLLVLGLLSGGVLGSAACRALRPVHVRPVAAEASRAFAEAQEVLRGAGRGSTDAVERARALLEQALVAEPGWVAPARLQDDLLRGELRGVEALAARRARLDEEGEDARGLYLAGRLEGDEGEPRFERAAELDPDFAWARHGLAWIASGREDVRAAVGHERAALHRARDPYERAAFASSLARFLSGAGRRDEAVALLRDELARPGLAGGDRVRLETEAVGMALGSARREESRAAFRQGLDLLRRSDLADSEVETLAAHLRLHSGRDESSRLSISTALASGRSPARDRLRAELMLASRPTPLALGLLERSLEGTSPEQRRLATAGPLMRAARFAAGEASEAVERWLEDLPAAVLGPDGRPRDARLARVVDAARTVGGARPGEGDGGRWFELGDALLDAGWFRESRALAGGLARADVDRALDLEARAAAGMELVDSVEELLLRADDAGAERAGGATAGSTEPAGVERDLDGLLAAIGPCFARMRGAFGEALDGEAVGRELVASPRLRYGPVGEVVHPGPWFSPTDEREGLGTAGAEVPGLARVASAIGRFALLGESLGSGGPDGTVLSRLHVEERRGDHLGVPWAGTVAWCEGADVRSRVERLGARISAAALHEGYWLDVQAVRGELGLYASLAARFGEEGEAGRVREILAGTGLPLRAGDPGARRRERALPGLALGEASRVRLAVLADRGDGGALGRVGIDDLVLVTATHEEGHLTDRTRFLPLSSHWGRALALLLDCGFSPTRVAERLEYRAQLVALCETPDPRTVLAPTLDAMEGEGRSPTAHAKGYEQLLRDLLGVLSDRLDEEPGSLPTIDPERTLLHQLHRLPPDAVRDLARRLARAKGLLR